MSFCRVSGYACLNEEAFPILGCYVSCSQCHVKFVKIVHTSIKLCSKQSCPEKTTTTWGEGGLFIEHLTVHIRACHCMEIMVESAIIILQEEGSACNWVLVTDCLSLWCFSVGFWCFFSPLSSFFKLFWHIYDGWQGKANPRAMTVMPIVEWIKNVELVCELCTMDKVERILPLYLWGGALAVYRRLSKEQKAEAAQIKQALITAYTTDKFNAFNQLVSQRLHPGETVEEFLADLHQLARLIGELLPDQWMTCAFMLGLPQHVRQRLRASSQMDAMNLDLGEGYHDGGCEVSVATSVEQLHSNAGRSFFFYIAQQYSYLLQVLWV